MEVIGTEQFEAWFLSLAQAEARRVAAGVDFLAEHGPGLGRPHVDTLTASRHPNLKELRVGTIRVLFFFDPARDLLLLLGGDKRGRWQAFYTEAIPLADQLIDEHLNTLTPKPKETP